MQTPVQPVNSPGVELLEKALKILIFAVSLAIPVGLARGDVLNSMLKHPVVFCLLFDCFLIHWLTGGSRRETLAAAGGGVLALAVWMAMGGKPGSYVEGLMILGSTMGIASLIVLSFCAILANGPAGRRKLTTFGRGALFLCLALWSVPLLSVANRFRPLKLDPMLYRFDAGFGAEWSFRMGQIFATHPGFAAAEKAIYLSLAVPVALVYILHLRRPGNWPIDVLGAFILNAVVGYVLFFIFPAAGPAFAFSPLYPFHPPPIPAVNMTRLALDALPNAMPSVHVSTALLIWFNARPSRIARLLAGLFLVTTIIATLGLGEHYIVDVVVAFPYAFFVQAVCVSLPGAGRQALAMLALTLGWLAFLGFGPALFPSTPLAFMLGLLSVGLTLVMERKLAHAMRAEAFSAGVPEINSMGESAP